MMAMQLQSTLPVLQMHLGRDDLSATATYSIGEPKIFMKPEHNMNANA
jgi:hypothetical protein